MEHIDALLLLRSKSAAQAPGFVATGPHSMQAPQQMMAEHAPPPAGPDPAMMQAQMEQQAEQQQQQMMAEAEQQQQQMMAQSEQERTRLELENAKLKMEQQTAKIQLDAQKAQMSAQQAVAKAQNDAAQAKLQLEAEKAHSRTTQEESHLSEQQAALQAARTQAQADLERQKSELREEAVHSHEQAVVDQAQTQQLESKAQAQREVANTQMGMREQNMAQKLKDRTTHQKLAFWQEFYGLGKSASTPASAPAVPEAAPQRKLVAPINAASNVTMGGTNTVDTTQTAPKPITLSADQYRQEMGDRVGQPGAMNNWLAVQRRRHGDNVQFEGPQADSMQRAFTRSGQDPIQNSGPTGFDRYNPLAWVGHTLGQVPESSDAYDKWLHEGTGNFWDKDYKFRGSWNPVNHIGAMGSGLVRPAVRYFDQYGRDAAAGNYGRAAGHLGAGMYETGRVAALALTGGAGASAKGPFSAMNAATRTKTTLAQANRVRQLQGLSPLTQPWRSAAPGLARSTGAYMGLDMAGGRLKERMGLNFTDADANIVNQRNRQFTDMRRNVLSAANERAWNNLHDGGGFRSLQAQNRYGQYGAAGRSPWGYQSTSNQPQSGWSEMLRDLMGGFMNQATTRPGSVFN